LAKHYQSTLRRKAVAEVRVITGLKLNAEVVFGKE
jgi:hypothetical protein